MKTYTPNQEKVIGLNSGYNMVLAGPGCGKTDILAERIARACESGRTGLDDILCLTFTNRAARGMYDRIRQRLGPDSEDLFVGNVHRYCSHFLFENGLVSPEAAILDEDDLNEIVQTEIPDGDVMLLIEYHEVNVHGSVLYSVNWDVVHDLLGIPIYSSGSSGLIQKEKATKIISAAKVAVMQLQHLMEQARRGHPREIFTYAGLLELPLMKAAFLFPDDFRRACANARYDASSFVNLSHVKQYLALAAKFGEYKRKACLLDFDDLLINTYTEYSADTEGKYKRYSWVQVDEVQDLSPFQIALVDRFTDTSGEFVALYLGDEQQAIYSFMGATLSTLDMLKTRCGSNIFRLEKNFRSPKYLLDIYNEYATKELGVDRDFLPEPKDDAKAGRYDVCVHCYESLGDETEKVYGTVLPFLRSGEFSTEKPRTALLVPWNSDANEISDRLTRDGIRHFKISGSDIFQTVHMRLLVAHLNAVSNDFNMMAWSRILKQTYAVDTFLDGRHLISRMRDVAMSPSDLLRPDGGTYLAEFCRRFDTEEMVLFDTETTGTDVFSDDIVQIAAVKIRRGAVVPGSEFNLFLHTDREIPAKLGRLVNPMVEEYARAVKVPRSEGLRRFMSYVGDLTLMGHNVQFDYNILKNNLGRDCPGEYGGFSADTLDTLHLAHLLHPRLRRYKLAYLLEALGLEGANSHMADDDIMATWELARHCRSEAGRHLGNQRAFLLSKEVRQAAEELSLSYRECYEHAKRNMYVLREDGACALVEELRYADGFLTKACEVRSVDHFGDILSFLGTDVVAPSEPDALAAHLSNHLMDLSTFREADLCDSSSFKENLFVSTVHKAKGLEFENVIVMRAVEGRYPHFSHHREEEKMEDRRLFYVAISRSMKRLIISGADTGRIPVETMTPFLSRVAGHFLVRRELYASPLTGKRILSEVSGEYLTVKFYDGGALKSETCYGPLTGYFAERGSNPLDLSRGLRRNCSGSDALDRVDRMMRYLGIPVKK